MDENKSNVVGNGYLACGKYQSVAPDLTDECYDARNKGVAGPVFGNTHFDRVIVTTQKIGETWRARALAAVSRWDYEACKYCSQVVVEVRVGIDEPILCNLIDICGRSFVNFGVEHVCSPGEEFGE